MLESLGLGEMRSLLWTALGVVVLLLVWETSVAQSAHWQFVLPQPSRIAASVVEMHEQLFVHSVATSKVIAGGLLLALSVAFPLAVVMVLSASCRRVLSPLLVLSQCLPMFALAPLMVVWFGWTYTATLIPTALMVFFPVTTNLYQGMVSTPQSYLDYFVLQGATPWQTLVKLRLPYGLPHLCSGLRIAITWAVMGAVVGEWAGAQQGLGIFMLESRRSADVSAVFAAILCLMTLGLIGMSISSILESWASRMMGSTVSSVRWHRGHLRHYGVVSAAVVIVLVVLGCGSHDAAKPKLRLVLDWLPNPNHVPLYVGVEEGIFAKHGVDLEIVKVQDPGDPIPYVTSGKVDLALTYMPSLILGANAQGAQLRTVGYLIKEPLNALIFPTDTSVKGLQGLAGRTIGYSTDDLQTRTLKHLVQHNHIDDARLVNISFDLVSMLGTRQVDAIFGAYWNIEIEHLRQLGIETDYVTVTDMGMPHYFELIVVTGDDSVFSVEGFKAALDESIRHCRRYPHRALRSYFKANPDKNVDTQEWEARAWQKTLPTLANTQDDEPLVWDTFQQWLEQHQLLPARG